MIDNNISDFTINQKSFISFLNILVFSKITNIKTCLFKNIDYKKNYDNFIFKKGLVYFFYFSLNKNCNYLLISWKNDLNFKESFFKNFDYIDNYIEILKILSNDSYYKNLINYKLSWIDQLYVSDFLDFMDDSNIILNEESGIITNLAEEIILTDAKKKFLEILNSNPTNIISSQIFFLKNN